MAKELNFYPPSNNGGSYWPVRYNEDLTVCTFFLQTGIFFVNVGILFNYQSFIILICMFLISTKWYFNPKYCFHENHATVAEGRFLGTVCLYDYRQPAYLFFDAIYYNRLQKLKFTCCQFFVYISADSLRGGRHNCPGKAEQWHDQTGLNSLPIHKFKRLDKYTGSAGKTWKQEWQI